MTGRWLGFALAALMLWPASAMAQAPGVPGNPTNPADFLNNPHPTMRWFGIATPYGQVMRWVWMPPEPVVVNDQVVYQPGYWVSQTTAGNYYPTRWVLREVSPGTFGWVLLNGGAVPFAR